MKRKFDFESELLEALEGSSAGEDSSKDTCDLDDGLINDRLGRKASNSEASSSLASEGSWQGPLGALPEEVLTRVMEYMSAEDLNLVNQVCRYLKMLTADNRFWQPLYQLRWGVAGDTRVPERLGGALTWKEKYMAHDALELQEVARGLPEAMQSYFVQMAVAKRAMACGPHEEASITDDKAVARKISLWRAARGFRNAPSGRHHFCTGRSTYARLADNLYLCERCGWAHVCGDDCDAGVVDSCSELSVCPISGYCFDRMMSEWEESCRDKDPRGDEKAEEAAEEGGPTGSLAQAYLLGYNAANEFELQKVCFGRWDRVGR
eukprot:jgi/Botrbrau1/20173/Bobra.0173s0071.1